MFGNNEGKELLKETIRTLEAADQLSEKDRKSVAKYVFAESIKSVQEIEGFPGIKSKRFLKNNDDHNKTFITIINKAKELSNFHAYFQTSISLTFNNETIFFKGVVRGKISSEPRGKYGFHYDPIFIPKGSEKTFGEMSIEEKNKISHRSRAINELKKFLIKSIN